MNNQWLVSIEICKVNKNVKIKNTGKEIRFWYQTVIAKLLFKQK